MIVRPEQFRFNVEKARDLSALAVDETLTQEQKDLVSEPDTDQPFLTEVRSFCFYCAEKLTVPAIAWHGCAGKHPGDTTEVWLHPKCADQLSARIRRDANELKIGKQKADEQLDAWKRDHPI